MWDFSGRNFPWTDLVSLLAFFGLERLLLAS